MPWIESPRSRGLHEVRPLPQRRHRLTPWQRVTTLCGAYLNRVLDMLPPVHWVARRNHRHLLPEDVALQFRRGGESLHGLRIAFLSDIHAGSFMGERDLERIFARVADAEPDLVCLGGDILNTRPRELELLSRPLRMLQPRYGVFAVPGNHDRYWGPPVDEWCGFMVDHGVEPIINRGVRVEHEGHSLWLCGVDDLTEGDPQLEAAIEGAREDEPIVLLSHHPDYFAQAAAAGVDLTLSGHTHGGQIHFLGWTPLDHTHHRFWHGHFRVEESQLYVGRGVGVTILPLRMGARPELPVFRIEL